MGQPDADIILAVQNLFHTFDGGRRYVLFDVNFEIASGEIVGLVGPSGCGKSTLLRAILGTHPATDGQVVVYGAPGKRDPRIIRSPSSDIGIVYQRYSLFPNLTALGNVAFGLLLRDTSIPQRLLRFWPFYCEPVRRRATWAALRKHHLQAAQALLRKLKIGHEDEGVMHRYPHQLSGGMCQRVAIAQALILRPRILLLDEPFGALDEATREELQTMLLELYAENVAAKRRGGPPPHSIIIVTHELREALLVSDRVLGLSQYWDGAGGGDRRARGASTIVYDQAAPVFLPQGDRDLGRIAAQTRQIRRQVFDPAVLQRREDFVKFWDQVQDGQVEGILKDEPGH
jgi:NitT/TauT family transport system ATP-binding protein